MGFKIVFTKPAISDLHDLVGYISHDNPQAAEQLGYTIIEKSGQLSEFPLFGRVVPEFKIENIREMIHHPYRIIYRVHDEQKLIEICVCGTPGII